MMQQEKDASQSTHEPESLVVGAWWQSEVEDIAHVSRFLFCARIRTSAKGNGSHSDRLCDFSISLLNSK